MLQLRAPRMELLRRPLPQPKVARLLSQRWELAGPLLPHLRLPQQRKTEAQPPRRWKKVASSVLVGVITLGFLLGPGQWLWRAVRNTGYLWVSGSGPAPVKLVLLHDGAFFKELSGIGYSGFGVPLGEYTCEATYDSAKWTCQFDFTTDSLFSSRGTTKQTDRLSFPVRRGEGSTRRAPAPSDNIQRRNSFEKGSSGWSPEPGSAEPSRICGPKCEARRLGLDNSEPVATAFGVAPEATLR